MTEILCGALLLTAWVFPYLVIQAAAVRAIYRVRRGVTLTAIEVRANAAMAAAVGAVASVLKITQPIIENGIANAVM